MQFDYRNLGDVRMYYDSTVVFCPELEKFVFIRATWDDYADVWCDGENLRIERKAGAVVPVYSDPGYLPDMLIYGFISVVPRQRVSVGYHSSNLAMISGERKSMIGMGREELKLLANCLNHRDENLPSFQDDSLENKKSVIHKDIMTAPVDNNCVIVYYRGECVGTFDTDTKTLSLSEGNFFLKEVFESFNIYVKSMRGEEQVVVPRGEGPIWPVEAIGHGHHIRNNWEVRPNIDFGRQDVRWENQLIGEDEIDE